MASGLTFFPEGTQWLWRIMVLVTSQSTISIPPHWPGMSAAIPGPDGWTPSPSGCAITPPGCASNREGRSLDGPPNRTMFGVEVFIYTSPQQCIFGCFYLHSLIQVCYNYYLYHIWSWNCYSYCVLVSFLWCSTEVRSIDRFVEGLLSSLCKHIFEYLKGRFIK